MASAQPPGRINTIRNWAWPGNLVYKPDAPLKVSRLNLESNPSAVLQKLIRNF